MFDDLNVKIAFDLADAPNALAQLGKIQTAVDNVSERATQAEFKARAFATSLSAISSVTQPVAALTGRMTVLSGVMSLVVSGVNTLAAGFAVVHNLAVSLAAGLGFVMMPLRGLVMLPGMIMAAFRAMFATIIAPFKVLFGIVSAVFSALMMLMTPVIAIAKGFFMLKIGLHSLGLQFKILSGILAILPPQVRAIVIGLVALGATGRVGSFVLGGLAKALNLVNFGMLALQNPVKAAGVALANAAKAMLSLASAAGRATIAVFAMARSAVSAAITGLKSMTSSALQAASAIGSRLYSAASVGVNVIGTLAAAAVAFGMKTAIGLETAETVFGVLLKDMAQGKALMATLNATKVAPFFDSKQIQNAGRDLIKANVPVTQVATKLEQLGQIAVATKTPIDDLSRIYRQGMAKGAFQTDLVNQMAERGIDIYHALTAVTGLQGEALSKAMSDGKIGAEEMNKAIEHLTTGQGIYAGAVEAVGKTTGGMFSKIANNVQQAFGAMFSSGNTMLGSMLQSVVTMTEGWKTSFVQLQPVVVQVMMAVVDAFKLLFDFAVAVWTGIFGAGQASFSGLIAVGMEWATRFRWFFQNFGDIARFAFVQLSLFAVSAFNDLIYFFTDVIPAYLSWFGDNWKQVFTDAGNLIVTVFSNIATNIKSAMTAIWDFIKSGGTAELKFAFVPLLDGFKATVSQLPNIPDRAMTQLEKDLNSQVESLGTTLADNFDKLSAEASAQLNITLPETQLKDAATQAMGETGTEKTSKKVVENKAAKVNSAEGQSVVAQFMNAFKKDDQKEGVKAQKDAAKHLEHIAREVDRGRPIVGRAFA